MREGGGGARGEDLPLRAPRAREGWAVVALAGLIVVTIAWWAAALWPLPETTPDWVVRARTACFGTSGSGLPDSGGWLLLAGAPIGMMAALVVIARGELTGGIRRLRASIAGRFAIGAVVLVLVAGAGAAAVRVANLYGWGAPPAGLGAPTLVHLSRPAPPLALTGQAGDRVDLESFRGRPVLVTFAYGKCETVCPLVVHDALTAQTNTADLGTVLLVVTLDPWRDTPARLPHIATSWSLGPDAYLLGGPVDDVEGALDAWDVGRSRDARTGEVAHTALVYVVDRYGRLAFLVAGGATRITEAVRALEPVTASRTGGPA